MFAVLYRRLAVMGLLVSLCACAIPPALAPTVSATSLATTPDSTATITPPAPIVKPATTEGPAETALPFVDKNHNVFFAFGSTELSAAARTVIAELSKSLLANVDTRALLVGYSDNVGSREYSIALSGKRASTVEAEFRKLGVRPSQLRKASRGNRQFNQPCKSEACRRLMRRVEIQIATRFP